MKLWIDDLRPAPFGYRIARSVNEAIEIIETYEIMKLAVERELNKR